MFEFNLEAAKENGSNGGSKILDTGVYDVTIVTASKSVAGTGTTGIDWSLQVEGSKYPNMVYGMWTNKANGDAINFNMNKVQGLMGLAGAKKLTEFTKEIDVKDGKKKVTAFKEIDGFKCKVAVYKVLDWYNGEAREKNEIEIFLDTDGKTFAEKLKGSEAKQIKYYSEKMKDKETDAYKKAMADGEGESLEVDATDESESDEGIL